MDRLPRAAMAVSTRKRRESQGRLLHSFITLLAFVAGGIGGFFMGTACLGKMQSVFVVPGTSYEEGECEIESVGLNTKDFMLRKHKT